MGRDFGALWTALSTSPFSTAVGLGPRGANRIKSEGKANKPKTNAAQSQAAAAGAAPPWGFGEAKGSRKYIAATIRR